jgi:DNA-binding winged helix-turn-helix (wHTH) protein/tetratricopeptide (TPR) repeat protein
MPHSIYRFGDIRIDPSARELRNGGALATLSPKVFDCLIYLIEHRERAVGRDELIAAVWGKVDVTDTLLGQTVMKARRAVGDTGNGQNVIRTIPRFGYRWVAELEAEEAAPRAPEETIASSTTAPSADNAFDRELKTPKDWPAAATPDNHSSTIVAQPIEPVASAKRSRRVPQIAALVVAAFALAWGAYALRERATEKTPSTQTTPHDTTVDTAAVLPVTVNGDDESTWMRLGLMDLIAARLRGAGQPVVPSDNVVALLRASGEASGGGDALRSVREATGARYVVVARIARSARDWNVGIELRGADGAMREVHAQGADPIDTARAASDRLLAVLGKSPPPERDGTSTPSLAELQQRTEAALLSDDFVTARQLIQEAPPALRETPVMRLRLGQIDFRSGQLGAARSNLDALLADTPAESEPVLRARALYILGGVALRQDRNDDALRAFGESIALTSTRNEPAVLGQAYTGLAATLVNLGRFDEAADNLGRARVAVELAGDTLALARVDANEGVLDNARGRHAEALPILQRAAQRFAQFGALNELFLTVAAQMKADLALLDPAAAVAASEPVWTMRAKLNNPGSRTAFELQRARALAATGRLADARSLLDELGRATPTEQQTGLPGDVASESARLYLAAGNAQAAAESARLAVARLPTVDEARERARAWLTLSRALRAAGRDEDARDQVAEFLRWAATHSQMPSVTLFAALASAEQAAAERRREDAYKSYDTALGDAERWAVPADLAAVAISYAGSLIADSELERASAVTGRVARWAERDFDCALLQARLYHALGQPATWQTALGRARALAGERLIPALLTSPPAAPAVGAS